MCRSKVVQLMCRMFGVPGLSLSCWKHTSKLLVVLSSFSGLLMNMQRLNEICILPSWTQLTSVSTEVKIWVVLIPDTILVPPFCTFLNRKSFYKLKAEYSFPTCPEECGSEIRLSSEMLQVYRACCYQLSAWLWVSHCLFTLSAIVSGDLMASGKPGV